MATGDAESPNNVASTFFQYSTFASERPYVRPWGRQTFFLPWAPSNLVVPWTRPSTNHTPRSLTLIFVGNTSLYSKCMF